MSHAFRLLPIAVLLSFSGALSAKVPESALARVCLPPAPDARMNPDGEARVVSRTRSSRLGKRPTDDAPVVEMYVQGRLALRVEGFGTPSERREEYRYDPRGRLQEVAIFQSYGTLTRTYTYNSLGRVVLVNERSVDEKYSVPLVDNTYSCRYDGGLLIAVDLKVLSATSLLDSISAPKGADVALKYNQNSYKYSYDSRGNLYSEKNYVLTSAKNRWEMVWESLYAYDENGKLKSESLSGRDAYGVKYNTRTQYRGDDHVSWDSRESRPLRTQIEYIKFDGRKNWTLQRRRVYDATSGELIETNETTRTLEYLP